MRGLAERDAQLDLGVKGVSVAVDKIELSTYEL